MAGFDQTINYTVNVDDTNFQSKLTQMRASLDSTIGMGGMSPQMAYGMMGVMGQGGAAGGYAGYGGMSPVGAAIRPITYTPPAIAMQPHFGMYQVHQTLGQAGLASAGAHIWGPIRTPEGISAAEYRATSARGFADRVGDAAAVTGFSLAAGIPDLLIGGYAAQAGSAMFGGGVAGFFGGMAVGALATAPITAYSGGVMSQLAENRRYQADLARGSFRFFTGGGSEVDPYTGRGMSRDTRRDVASSIQQMEMSDLRYGGAEFREVLSAGMQSDMFNGVKDAQAFKEKFKSLVDTVKTVTSTLHTTIREGVETLRSLRDIGVDEAGEANRLVVGSEMRGRATGRTGQEMMALGLAGAEQFRGTGISMSKGFELNQMNVESVQNMLRDRQITRETVEQAGGVNALAQQMTANQMSAFQSSYGRAMMMGSFNTQTKEVDPNLAASVARGNLQGNVFKAAGMTPEDLINYQAHQEEVISKLGPEQMQTFGLAIQMNMAQELKKIAPKTEFETLMKFAGQKLGYSKEIIDTNIGLLHRDPDKMQEDMETSLTTMRSQAYMEDIRNNRNILKYVSNQVRRNVFQPMSDVLSKTSADIGDFLEKTSYELSGVQALDPKVVSKESYAAGREYLKSLEKAGVAPTSPGLVFTDKVNTETSFTTALRESGVLLPLQTSTAFANRVVEAGKFDAGSSSYSYHGLDFKSFENREQAENFAKQYPTLGGSMTKTKGGQYVMVLDEQTKKLQDRSRMSEYSQKEFEEAKGKKMSTEKLQDVMERTNMASSLEDVTKALFHDDVGKKGDVNNLYNDIFENTGMDEEKFKETYGHTRGYYTASLDVTTQKFGNRMSKAREEFKKEREESGNIASLDATERAAYGKEISSADATLLADVKSKTGEWDFWKKASNKLINAYSNMRGAGDAVAEDAQYNSLYHAKIKMVGAEPGSEGTDLGEWFEKNPQALAKIHSEVGKGGKVETISQLMANEYGVQSDSIRGFVAQVAEDYRTDEKKGKANAAAADKRLTRSGQLEAHDRFMMGGGGDATTGGPAATGELSKDMVKVLEAQSTQLLNNHKQLINMMKILNDLQKDHKGGFWG